jgi:hypothetical protein
VPESKPIQYLVRLRLPGGAEKESGPFATHSQAAGDVVNLPIGPDGKAGPGKGHVWRVVAVETGPLLVLDYVQPHRTAD